MRQTNSPMSFLQSSIPLNSSLAKYRRGVEIFVEFSTRCLLSCSHCSSATGEDEGRLRKVAYLQDLATFLSIAPSDSDLYICLTGGEPLIAPELREILTICSAYPQVNSIGVCTSGYTENTQLNYHSITTQTASLLAGSGLSFAYVSLYSDIALYHDAVTGKPGSFLATISSIDRLVDAGVDVRIHFVPMKTNSVSITRLAHLAVQHHVSEIRLLRLVKHGRAKDNWNSIGLSTEVQEKLVRNILHYVELHNLPLHITAAAFPQVCDCRPFPLGPGCQAGLRLFYIDHEGSIFPCACMKRIPNAAVGSLRKPHYFWDRLSFISSYRADCWQDYSQHCNRKTQFGGGMHEQHIDSRDTSPSKQYTE